VRSCGALQAGFIFGQRQRHHLGRAPDEVSVRGADRPVTARIPGRCLFADAAKCGLNRSLTKCHRHGEDHAPMP
jgi:hypothetical protein